MELSGHTRPFAVLGHPIGHTLSPRMHNAAFSKLGMDAVYLAFDVAPDRLMKVLPAMADMGFGGINLTVPLKEVAFRKLRLLDEPASLLGAVNTVEICSKGLVGHNTDGPGFLKAVDEAFGVGVRGLSIFILGAGGAGRAIAITCAKQKAGRIVLADELAKRARKLAGEISSLAPAVKIQPVELGSGQLIDLLGEADLVVNATPVGMRRDDHFPIRAADLRDNQLAFDLVYMFPETAFMKQARMAGAKAANGLGMLLHQGVLAFEIWTGVKPPVAIMRCALEDAVYGKNRYPRKKVVR